MIRRYPARVFFCYRHMGLSVIAIVGSEAKLK